MIFVVWLQQKTLASYPYYKYDEKLRELNKFQVYNNLELSSQVHPPAAGIVLFKTFFNTISNKWCFPGVDYFFRASYDGHGCLLSIAKR